MLLRRGSRVSLSNPSQTPTLDMPSTLRPLTFSAVPIPQLKPKLKNKIYYRKFTSGGAMAPDLLQGTPRASASLDEPNPPSSSPKQKYIKDPNNVVAQRLFMDSMAKRLNYTSLEDWYRASWRDFHANSGGWILRLYNQSPSLTVSSVYHEHEFLPWRFRATSKGYFTIRENRVRYLEWLKKKVGANRFEDLSIENFREHHGGGLIMLYGGSPQGILDSLIPERVETLVESSEKFEDSPTRVQKQLNFWNSLENQRSFLDSIGAKIGVKGTDLSPWYKMDRTALTRYGCMGLLTQNYSGSHYSMLKNVYSEHNWIPWKFKRLPMAIRRDPGVVRLALDFVKTELNISKPEDWYQVSMATLQKLGVSALFVPGGLYQALRENMPDFSWEEGRFVGSSDWREGKRE